MRDNKPHFHVTAGIIRRNGRLLITRRPRGGHLGGLWEFPGGKQEGAESLEECLVREIREELGIDVEPGECILVKDHEYEAKRVTLHFFACSPKGIGPVRGLEGQEVRWVRPEKLASYRFPPPDLSVIEHLLTEGNGRAIPHGFARPLRDNGEY